MIAGPNGSGKSTIYRLLDQNYDTGIYLNADDIEKELLTGINLSKYGLEDVSGRTFVEFILEHSLAKKAMKISRKNSAIIFMNKLPAIEHAIMSGEA